MTNRTASAPGRLAQPTTVQRPGPRGLEISNLTKTFRRKGSNAQVTAIDNVSLSVREGELLVLLGPSGCGKTTILRSVAGLEQPDSGEIQVDGTSVYSSPNRVNLPANRRKLAVIFQSYALWPHMTVAENVAYPLRVAKDRKNIDIPARVQEALDLVGLSSLGKEYPGTLSGGQQQRVSLARALVSHPSVILFDEPLSNIDAQVRYTLREEIANMHRRINFSAVYVTHDQEEALALADRIAVLKGGKVEQLGTPHEVYKTPATKYVAEFVGRANIISVQAGHPQVGVMAVTSGAGDFYIDSRGIAEDVAIGSTAYAVIRAEDIDITASLHASPDAKFNCLPAEVTSVQFLGPRTEVLARLHDGTAIRIETNRAVLPEIGDRIGCTFARDAARLVSR
ncbi:ABC transporter ATP-binding protein [Pseudarthrobacter sp. YAF2]|uniref:ABC transporter ATP-binding protein n=1 Tax=Pseudarthrobacter sp. YAF2 TaxID=3233078 RepID=UPI003F983FA2